MQSLGTALKRMGTGMNKTKKQNRFHINHCNLKEYDFWNRWNRKNREKSGYTQNGVKKVKIFQNIENTLDNTNVSSIQNRSNEQALIKQEDTSTSLSNREIYIYYFNNNSILQVEKSGSSGNPQIEYVTSTVCAERAFNELEQATTPVALDIETYPKEGGSALDPFTSEIRLVQCYSGGDKAYVFDLHHIPLSSFPSSIWKKPIVCHNALFELKHLLHRGCPLENVGCTMLMGFVLQGYSKGGDLSLKGLSKKYLGIELSKEEQLSDWSAGELSKSQIEYASKDAVVAYQLFQYLHQELSERGLLTSYILRRDAQIPIARMMLNGTAFNVNSHNQLIEKWKEQESYYQEKLNQSLGSINLDSPKQICECLTNHVNRDLLSKWPKTAKGNLATGSKVIARFRDHISWADDFFHFKKIHKKSTTYGKKLQRHIHPNTGRIHPEILLAGTDTGRLSSRKPNVQNFPRDDQFRELFESPEGKVLIVADYSQIELRVASIVAQDIAMLGIYERGEDLHKKTASAVIGISENTVTKEQRQLAKAVNFGFLYGQGAEGFVTYAKDNYGVDVTLEEATQAKDRFLSAYPDLRRWQYRTRRDARSSLKVRTPCGFIRRFKDPKHTYNQALNTPIQGGASEVMLKALYLLDQSVDYEKAKLVNCIHDEIVLEVDEDYKEKAIKVLEGSMIKAFSTIFPTESTNKLVEVKSAKNWRDAK